MENETQKKQSSAKNEQQPINYVCIHCCEPQSKIVRSLYKDNYCLEKCKKCHEVSDKYVEYESNLQILSVLLCFT